MKMFCWTLNLVADGSDLMTSLCLGDPGEVNRGENRDGKHFKGDQGSEKSADEAKLFLLVPQYFQVQRLFVVGIGRVNDDQSPPLDTLVAARCRGETTEDLHFL